MTGWLLDTNVLSELRRPKPARKVVQFIAAQSLDLLYVSVVTFAETRFGIELVQHHGLTIVTRDTSEYALAHVSVFNPWTD